MTVVSTPRFRVAIVSRDAAFADALATILRADPAVSLGATTSSTDPSALGHPLPDLVLVDADSYDRHDDALAALVASARSSAPESAICAFSCRVDSGWARAAMQAGARGFVLKDARPATLREVLHGLRRGELYVDPRIAPGLFEPARRPASRSRDLSEREIEILRLIAAGHSNRTIAQRLGISEKTVKNHVSRIFVKLDVTARSHAAVYAIKTGIA